MTVSSHYKDIDGNLPFSSAFSVENICTINLIDRHNGFFALLGTVAVASFTWTLWRSTEKLWKAGEQTAQAQLRAYVYIANVYTTERNGQRVIEITIKNFGQTPAYDFGLILWCGVLSIPLNINHLPKLPPVENSPKRTLPPKAISDTSFQIINLSEEQINAIAVGTLGLWVIGTITYMDIFKNTHFENIRMICTEKNWEKGAFNVP